MEHLGGMLDRRPNMTASHFLASNSANLRLGRQSCIHTCLDLQMSRSTLMATSLVAPERLARLEKLATTVTFGPEFNVVRFKRPALLGWRITAGHTIQGGGGGAWTATCYLRTD